MAQGGKGKKLPSLLEKKDVANTARTAIRKEAEESNSMVSGSTTTFVDVLYYITETVFFIITFPPLLWMKSILFTLSREKQDLNYLICFLTISNW
jgi:hypothetical protein